MKLRKGKSRAKYISENLFNDALVYDWTNDFEEAAEALNVSIASLKSRLHRARILLRKHLDEYPSLALLPPPTRLLTPVKPWSDSLAFSGLIFLPFSSPIY